MRYRNFLKSRLIGDIPDDLPLPSGFHLVGHVALVRLDFDLMDYAEKIGIATLEYDSRIRSVAVRIGPTKGRTRKPSYSIVAGDNNTITTHIENGVIFKLDPLCFTFSGGNRGERMRVAKLAKPGEKVVDMFSCVGQFALHIAKAANVKVTAIEINPEAFDFLLENIQLNRLAERVTPVLGDCREVHPIGDANRVVMGFLHDTISYLPAALETLVDTGGIIHMHLSIPESETESAIVEIEKKCTDYGYQSDTELNKIKNYSPGIEHFVFDIFVNRNKA
ncbi:MAG: class I SAM-dependent methyltransferase family protein [Candidatus Thorarchaeota archaeon]